MIAAIVRTLLAISVLAWVADRLLARSRKGGRPAPVVTRGIIDAPIEQVFRELADVAGQPRWMHDMKSVSMEPGPLQVGSRGQATVRMYGVAVTDPVRILHLDPPTRFGVSHDGIFAGHGIFDLERQSDGATAIRWEEDLVAPVLPHLVAAVTGPVFRKVFERDLARFRSLVEGS